MKKSLLLTTVALVVPFLFSCSNEEELIPVSSIALSESDVTLKVGEEKRVTSTISPENATEKTIVWKTSHPNSVTVVGGLLHAYSVPKDTDKVTITASNRDETISASLSVTVLPADPAAAIEADGITISSETVSLVLDGDKAITTISATVTPFEYGNRNVEWISSAPSVVSLSEVVQPNPEGSTLEAKKSSKVKLTGLTEGSAKVTAKCGDFSVSCAVTVSNKPEAIQIFSYGQKDVDIEQGETKTNPLTVLPYNALDGETVNYTSDNAKVSVSSEGAVTVANDAPVGSTATITAAVVGTVFYDSYIVHVTRPWINYLHMKAHDTSLWTNEDIALKGGSATEYILENRSFNRGDLFCFCIGRTDWYKFDQVKNNTTESTEPKVCHLGVEYAQVGEDIKILKTGVYTIYVETAEENHGIWITAESTVSVVPVLTVFNGSTGISTNYNLSPKSEGSSEYVITQTINKDDYFYLDFDGEKYGYDMLKGGGVSDLFEGKSISSVTSLKCSETHSFTFYLETNPANYNEGKAIYARADYIKYSKPSTSEWLTMDCAVKVGDNGFPEYYKEGFKLEKGANFLARINGGYYKYDLLEEGGRKIWTYMSDESDRNIVTRVAGSFNLYFKTGDADGSSCTSIYMSGVTDNDLNYAEIHRSGQANPEARIPLTLKPGALDEFKLSNITLSNGDKIRFVNNVNQYETRLKSGGYSTKFNAAGSDGYFTYKEASPSTFDFYIKFMDGDENQLGIWADNYVPVYLYTLNITDSNRWIFDDNTKIFMWAWHREGVNDTDGHWYEGGHVDNAVIFALPQSLNLNYALTIRARSVPDLSSWDGLVENENYFNKTADFTISGSDSPITPY